MTVAPFSFDVLDPEAELGMGFYATDTPGLGGRLRASAQDFIVEEASAPVAQAQAGGKYTLASIKATNWETNRLVRQMARRLGISERGIFYAGTKDKRAVTVQNMAIAAPEETVTALELKDVEVLTTKRVDRAPKIGELTGNAFTIRLRDTEPEGDEALARAERIAGELLDQGGFPNFFGPQRFGSVRPITHLVGKALVEGDPERAVWTYIAAPAALDPHELAKPRRRAWETRDPVKALEHLPKQLDFERQLLHGLVEHPDEPVRAFEKLPHNLNRMFPSAYQSLLFNRMVTERARRRHPRAALVGDILHPARDDGTPDPTERVPVTERNAARCAEATASGLGFTTAALPGYGRELASGLQGEIERSVIEDEGVDLDGFRIYHAPRLASSGTRRAMWCPLETLNVSQGADDAGPFIELDFFLPKGSYATCLLREFMKTDLTSY